MDGWGEVSRIPATARSAPAPRGPEAPPITALLFDSTANLLWCGDAQGHTALFTPLLQENTPYRHMALYRYTKFRLLGAASPVVQLLNHQRGILSLLHGAVGFSLRRGVPNVALTAALWPAADRAAWAGLRSMALAYLTSHDLVVGGAAALFKVDLARPTQPTRFAHDGDVALVNYSSKLLTLGRLGGALEVFDPAANKSVKTFAGHNGMLSDLDVKGNYVATCGYSARMPRYGLASAAVEYMVDPLVNIYDLRTMRALSPLPFSAGASFVRFHPKLPNIVVIASANGQIQFVDIHDQLVVHLYQADLTDAAAAAGLLAAATSSYLAHLNISENGEFLCFADGYKNLHLWSMSSSTSQNFLNFPATLDQPAIPDNIVAALDHVALDDVVPLNSVGMPYYKEYLASNFPSDLVFIKESARIPKQVTDACLRPKTAPKSAPTRYHYDKAKYGARHVTPLYVSLKHAHGKTGAPSTKISSIPKFISERSMTSSPVAGGRAFESESPSLPAFATFHDFNDIDSDGASKFNAKTDAPGEQTDSTFQYKPDPSTPVPPCYGKLDIHYSRFGVDDFDFDYYNRSNGQFAGLENHLDNSYTNSLLQIYRHIPIFYNAVTKSLMSEYLPNDKKTIHDRGNPLGTSVLNELGYLFDMMHKAGARNVNISNFSLILNESDIAKNYGLLNTDDGKSLDSRELQELVVTFNKFLIESIVSDFRSQFSIDVQDLSATHYELEFFAPSGELLDKQYGSQVTLDLCSPPSHYLNRGGFGNRYTSQHLTKKNSTILNYLDYSLNQHRLIPASMNTPYEVEARQLFIDLGPVLLINLPLSDQEFDQIRSFKKWLVPEFYTVNSANKKLTFKPVIAQMNQRANKYELQGYVCEISHGLASCKGQHNLVSYVKIRSVSLGKDQWFLFNDFLVMPIPEDEVFNLSYLWKKPVVVVYSNSEDHRNQKFSYFECEMFRKLSSLNDGILYRDHFAYGTRQGYKKEYELLTRQEAPALGSLIAIDAEFVSLRPEVAEVSYTGSRNLVRPTLLSLARISVLRGDPGPKHGVPFIDDYIMHCKPIYDNLTNFSGIEEGDLDPTKSHKTLVTLQTAYRRLWLLMNLGCVFVGHGLKSDFRCINLQVPRSQIRDTIEFYHLPDFRRKLSLKFLAYSVLKESVQTRNHDSIEDARTALLLFERYMELRASGEFEQALRRIYSEGQQLRFRVPE
ncbi:hypothetical protein METBIDRAFT_9960 [Metschnikowia bicuspidata var. bicuspidata NRRL YB-4993]|uniref:PAN2-PAN3 deadenylation complex catalytic subunit PAN2 n=1 Tax=Metschnikowia bicuspidata var. bicuspidata NRRL YB-4993 TaxID=869754 RepID=A0A1A0HIK8_9ASCO|nr:hypothetical protein METBIDRAFT_9960 [Metschnikowia bicuspidata var. bicuspidata NRRL YB-4993]OBA23722.1 hypothetical protein METBIDRAFT_9960 [Metschnikowia bicuspidata var. bicuspidata NRRL YB-4993]